ncbi:MAG: MMPL family transporter [Planctomycetota bacterium]
MPVAFRASRLSLGKKENDVKDWLPADFVETSELEWFTDHFAGDAFVLATWEGCTADSPSLELFASKLAYEAATRDTGEGLPQGTAEIYRRAASIGRELGLMEADASYFNYGGQNEKWFTTSDNQWFYVLPNGRLYRWDQAISGPSALIRKIRKSRGTYELDGQLITAFSIPSSTGPGEEEPVNPFYNDPSLIAAPLIQTVQTGQMILDDLASPGGPLWPREFIDPSRRKLVAERRAMERLSGVLFAPATPQGFEWTVEAFEREANDAGREIEVDRFRYLVGQELDSIVEEQFDGSRDDLINATTEMRDRLWYQVFDAAEIDAPPRQSCVLITMTDLGKDNLAQVIGRGVMGGPRGRVMELADEAGLFAPLSPSVLPPPFNRAVPESSPNRPALRLGGPTVDNMAIDEEGTITLVRLVGYSMLLGFGLSYLCFRSFKITIMVFVVGGSAAMLSMSMVWWTGGRVDAILMSMPSLVYVLGLSGAIHVVNYYRDEVRVRGESGAAMRALKHAAIPCTLASLTTAIGLASLLTSNLAPISNFGLYSAIGVMATLGVLFSYLPAALEVFRPSVPQEVASSDVDAGIDGRIEGKLSRWWAGVGRTITSHHAPVSIVCLVLLIGAALSMQKLKTSVHLLELFDPGARIIRDYAWLESHFGKLVPMEVIVRMPPDVIAEENADKTGLKLTTLERVESIARIRQVVHRSLGEEGMDVVGQASAADTLLPTPPAVSNGYNPIRSKFNSEISNALDDIVDADYLRFEKDGPFKGSELWRISLRVAALSDVDYGQFIAQVRKAVAPVLAAHVAQQRLIDAVSMNPERGKRSKRALFVGSDKPPSIADVELLDDEGEILAGNAFEASLAEIVQGMSFKSSSMWINPTNELMSKWRSSGRLEQKFSEFDAVIWVDDGEFKQSDFGEGTKLVDLRDLRDFEPKRILVEGKYPATEGGGPIDAIYTGVIPVVYKAQRTLLQSLADSIGMAFVLIAGVMVVLLSPARRVIDRFRPGKLAYGVAAGAVAMIPNGFPVIMVFGAMCQLGIEIDIGTMMTASVAMGVAVDDTIHFLSWFRENLDRGLSRVEAVIETYRRVGPAMTQTTIVGGLGLFVFALSTFTPTQRFGTLMLVMLGAALVGDLILLPALLAGPLGRVFKPRGGGGQPVEPAMSEQITEQLARPADEVIRGIEEPAAPILRIHPPSMETHPKSAKQSRAARKSR